MTPKALSREDYKENGWDYALDTPIIIDGKPHTIRMEQGMTGIGSRHYWINGESRSERCATQSADLTKGNHFIYRINWRENPWDTLDLIISEEELPMLLDRELQPEWRNPIKREIN